MLGAQMPVTRPTPAPIGQYWVTCPPLRLPECCGGRCLAGRRVMGWRNPSASLSEDLAPLGHPPRPSCALVPLHLKSGGFPRIRSLGTFSL